MIRIIFILSILSCFIQKATAQKLELTQRDKVEFKERAVRTINMFKEALETIPQFEGEPILKDKAIANTLRLFAKGSKIELAYANGKKNNLKLPLYLNSLRNYASKGQLVDIEIIDFTVKDIEPHPTELGKYIIKFEFVQIFKKKKNFKPDPLMSKEELQLIEWDYVDKTTKSGIAYVEKNTTVNGTKWRLLLGDIKVEGIVILD